MLDSLLLLLNGGSRKELTVLKTIKNRIHGHDRELNIAIQEHTSKQAEILFAAVNHRYHKIFSYLLKVGFNPSIPLLPYGFNVLHHCVLNDLPKMTNICLEKSHVPLLETFSREGATPLFLAVQQQNITLVKALLAKGATVSTCDVHGLTPVGAALLTANADILEMLLAAPQSSPILFDHLSCQTRLLQSFYDLPIPVSRKIRCLNLLLAAGAGLELTHLPEEIFTAYGLQKCNVTDCLVLGEQQQPDGTWKKKLVSTTKGLTKVLLSATWRFNQKQLSRTCQHPLLKHLPVVQTLRDLLAPEPNQIPPLTPPMRLSSNNMPIIPILSGDALHEHIQQEYNLTQNCLRTINSLTCPQECILRLTTLMACTMQSVQNLIEISKYSPNAGQASFAIFNKLIASLMPIINTSVSLAGLPLMSNLDEKIARILKMHSDIQHSQQHLYNSLMDARALLNAKSARIYLAAGKHDVATHLALNALALNDQLIIDSPMLQASADLTQAICLASTAEVYLTQGWINKAYHHTSRAIDLLADAGLYDDLAVRQISQLAKLFAKRHHLTRSLTLIDKGLHYLTPLFLLTHEQAQAVPIEIVALKDLRQQLVYDYFQANVQKLIEHLGHVCEILPDADQHAVYLRPKVNVYTPLI